MYLLVVSRVKGIKGGRKMKKLKKITAVFLTTAMTMSLAACGGNAVDKKPDHNGGKEVIVMF